MTTTAKLKEYRHVEEPARRKRDGLQLLKASPQTRCSQGACGWSYPLISESHKDVPRRDYSQGRKTTT